MFDGKFHQHVPVENWNAEDNHYFPRGLVYLENPHMTEIEVYVDRIQRCCLYFEVDN